MAGTYTERFASQLPVLGDGQQKIREAVLALQGFGRVNSSIALILKAAGVTRLLVNDPQRFEPENGNCLDVNVEHYGLFKAERARDILTAEDVVCETFPVGNESLLAEECVQRATVVICASNTPESRRASMRNCVKYGRPYIGAGVVDGRNGLGGMIVTWLPDRPELACQACFLQEGVKPRSGEGLLFTVIAATAALAANVAVQMLTGVKDGFVRPHNVITIDLETYSVEALRVLKRPDCDVCGCRVG